MDVSILFPVRYVQRRTSASACTIGGLVFSRIMGIHALDPVSERYVVGNILRRRRRYAVFEYVGDEGLFVDCSE